MGYILPPAGLVQAVIWTAVPVVTPGAPPVVLAPQLDPATGERTSLFSGADPVFVAILLQFQTRYASGVSVLEDGTKLLEIRKATVDAPALARFEVARIFKWFVDRQLVRVDSVEAAVAKYRGRLFVKFTILPTGSAEELLV